MANNINSFMNLASSCMYPKDIKNPLMEDSILSGYLEPTNEGYALSKIVSTKLCEYISRENPLKKYKTVVFVHGCFWHRHKECKYASNPKTREEFWNKKFLSNIERDIKVRERIKAAGWKSIVVWECELKDIQKLKKRLIPLFDK